jgi:hypothetical protein
VLGCADKKKIKGLESSLASLVKAEAKAQADYDAVNAKKESLAQQVRNCVQLELPPLQALLCVVGPGTTVAQLLDYECCCCCHPPDSAYP